MSISYFVVDISDVSEADIDHDTHLCMAESFDPAVYWHRHSLLSECTGMCAVEL